MMNNMGGMLKKAQQMQKQMLKMQEELAQSTVEVAVGGGMVKVVANGVPQVISIEINPEVVDPNDVEMLQDLILSAVTEAITKAQEMVDKEMSKVTGGMGLPKGMF